VHLLIEPRSYGVISSPESALAVIAEAGSSNVRVVFDTAHMVGQNIPLGIAWATLKNKTQLIHLADNRPLDMRHATPGTGSVPWETMFNALSSLQEKVWLGIELLTFSPDCIGAYREALARLKQTAEKYGKADLFDFPVV